MKKIVYIFTILLGISLGCEEPLEVDPRLSVDSNNLITNASSAGVAMNGLYDGLQAVYGTGAPNIVPIVVDLVSDNLVHTGTFTSLREMDENDILATNVGISEFWNNLYNTIYRANVIIDLLPTVDDPVLDADRAQFEAEARVIRAICYYHLVNNWGAVPLITTPLETLDDVNVPRTAESEVNNQILADLNAAVPNLASDSDRTRVSKAAANAFLAKVQLQLGNYAEASAAAGAAISDPVGYTLETNYMDLYNANVSSEALLQVDFNSNDANSISFWYWDQPDGRHEIAPSDNNTLVYEEGDLRSSIVDSTVNSTSGPVFSRKYVDFATGADKPYVVRLADVLLTKAEADAQLGDFGAASDLINQVRTRAGLEPVTLDGGNFIEIISNERRVELAFEGHRWYDMKRYGTALDFLTSKGRGSNDLVLPIPDDEIDRNTAISQSDQNPGY